MNIFPEIVYGEIPKECGCQIMSRAIFLPTPEQRIPTCKNNVTRMIRLNNGHTIFSCGSHVKTNKRAYSGFYVDCLTRQMKTNLFHLPQPPPLPPLPPLPTPTAEQIARRNAIFEKKQLMEKNTLKTCCLPFNNMLSIEDCSICMEKITPSTGGHLPCKHGFHNGCITKWFNIKKSCPYCRAPCIIKL